MVYEFNARRLDTRLLELTGPDGPVALEPKCLSLLMFLIANRDRAVSRDEIFDAIWPSITVSEASLSTAILQVRRAVGDDGGSQSVIRTVRGHGFRFVGLVREIEAVPARPFPHDQNRATMPRGKPTVAIRPFHLIGGDAAQLAIAEAIPAELIATLSRLRWITVIARGSSFRFEASGADLADMSSQLAARFIVSGAVEWQEDHLAIFAELSDTATGQVIWSDRLSGPIADVYDLRARIARNLATALELRLPVHEADQLSHMPTENLDAWGHYHLGIRHMYRYNRADNEIAAHHFRTAVTMDPHFARSHAGLSYTEFQNAFQHFASDTGLHGKLALEHAEDALQLDPLDPFCNLIYGRAKWLLGDAEQGLVWVDRSIDLNPNYAFGYYNNATLNTVLCNGAKADENVETALTLSPLDPHLQSMFGTRALAAFVSGDLQCASAYADHALNAPNPHLYVFMIGAVVHSEAGDRDKAQACVDAIRSKSVPFGKSEFLTHFNLRQPDRLDALIASLNKLDI